MRHDQIIKTALGVGTAAGLSIGYRRRRWHLASLCAMATAGVAWNPLVVGIPTVALYLLMRKT